MIKKSKILSLIMSTVVCTSMLVGCGGANKQASNDDKEIVVWSYLMNEEAEKIDEIAQVWAKENNKEVKVIRDESGFQEFLQATNSAKGPDMIFGTAHNNLGTFYKAGLLEEVPDSFVDKSNYVDNDIWSAVSYDGKVCGVPISMETYALFYNKDKVKETPKNIEDLVKMAKDYGEHGFQFPINDFYYTSTFLQSYGGYIFGEKDGVLNPNDLGFNSPGAIKSYEFLQKLVQEDKLMSADITSDIANNSFKTGESIFYIGGPWDVAGFKESGVNFGVISIPNINGVQSKTLMGVQAAVVSSKSPVKDEAWSLLKYLINNSGEDLYKIGNRIPVLKSELDKDLVKNDEYTEGFVSQLKTAVPMPNISEAQSIWDATKNIQRILLGEDPKSVSEDIQSAVKNAIEVAN